jgi:hypothetical protein
MKSSRWKWLVVVFAAAALMIPAMLISQTPDGETPAEEEACDKYEGEGARQGLCIAYCEAQDCEGLKLDPESCVRIQQNFINYSIKKGYTPGKKPVPIDCRTTACSQEDIKFCRAREQDCQDPLTGDCVPRCSSTFLGFDDRGNPVCSLESKCKTCVGDQPKP